MKKAPKTIACYICGREFGTTSYGIHLTQCQKKFQDEQANLDKAERKKLPNPPAGLDDILAKKKLTAEELEAYNSEAFNIYNKKSLSECKGCGRTFNPDSLKVHMKSCKGVKDSAKGGSSGPSSATLGSSLGAGGGGMGRKPSKSPARGPKSLVCYICGKGFMKGSISIHLTQCADKFKKESNNLGIKRKLPEEPEELEQILALDKIPEDLLEAYNNKASKAYNDVGLMKCPNCSRTFNPDSLKTHMKSCNAKYGTDADPFSSPNKKKQARPQGIMCYICGKEYFSKSLEIHVKNCKEAWLREENLKPKNKRRPLPEPPKNFDDILCGKTAVMDKEAYNEEAFKNYNENALERCENCGRTFLPDRLVIHLRSCKGDKGKSKGSPTKVSGGGSHLAPGGGAEPKRSASKSPARGPPGLICYICGRKYGTKSLDIHLKQCKELWEKTEAQKPKNERRPCPEPPKNFEEMKINPAGSKAMDEYNNEAFKNYNEKALVPCEL